MWVRSWLWNLHGASSRGTSCPWLLQQQSSKTPRLPLDAWSGHREIVRSPTVGKRLTPISWVGRGTGAVRTQDSVFPMVLTIFEAWTATLGAKVKSRLLCTGIQVLQPDVLTPHFPVPRSLLASGCISLYPSGVSHHCSAKGCHFLLTWNCSLSVP